MITKNNSYKKKNPAPPLLKTSNSQRVKKPENSLNTLLEGLSDKQKLQIKTVVSDCGIEPDDPIFLLTMILTKAQLSLEPVPKELAALTEGINTEVADFLTQAQESYKQHKELHRNFYVTADRLSNLLNQKLSEIERYRQRKQNSLTLSSKRALLWCLLASTIGGFIAALTVASLMIISTFK